MAPSSSSSSSASFQSTQFPDATDAICGATNWLLNDRVLVFNSSLIFIPLLSVLLHHFLSDGKQKKGGTTFPLLLAWFNQNVIKRSSEDMERLGKVYIVNSIIVEKCLNKSKILKKRNIFSIFIGMQKSFKWEDRFFENTFVFIPNQNNTLLFFWMIP